jgi:carboxyl-terminal processing protease
MRLYLLILIFIIPSTINSFASGKTVFNDTNTYACLQQASRRLDEAFSIMQKHYYKKDAVNWDSLKTAAKEKLNNSGNCEDAYETINWCFRQMSELHSFLMPLSTAALYNNDASLLKAKPNLSKLVGKLKGELLADNSIAYLNIPWISTSDPEICRNIADSIQRLVETLDGKGIEKWIIDLRNNTGGNCWPMIAGVGPLLGEGVCGYFITKDQKLAISYKNGAAMQGRHVRCEVSRPYKLKSPNHWIVVLTGPKTSSSGEILALAFKGKSQTYLYGQPTAGFTTANASYPLSDKSLLVLTVCQEADRDGKIYEGSIMPDELIGNDPLYPYEDAVKSAAMMWLQIH